MKRLASIVAVGLLVSGCDSTGPGIDSLRVVNAGAEPITALTLTFPDEDVVIGDVGVGQQSPYVAVRHGVYAYASYQFSSGDSVVTQGVIDWVGARPLDGTRFTYTIGIVQLAGAWYLQLQQVTRDE